MKRLLVVLCGALLLAGVAVVPAGAAIGGGNSTTEVSGTLANSGVVTIQCDASNTPTGASIVGDSQVTTGSPLFVGGTFHYEVHIFTPGPNSWVFTARDGTSTLSGPISLMGPTTPPPPEPPYDRLGLIVTNGTGRFTNVVGGSLIQYTTPVTNLFSLPCGDTSTAATDAYFAGQLTNTSAVVAARYTGTATFTTVCDSSNNPVGFDSSFDAQVNGRPLGAGTVAVETTTSTTGNWTFTDKAGNTLYGTEAYLLPASPTELHYRLFIDGGTGKFAAVTSGALFSEPFPTPSSGACGATTDATLSGTFSGELTNS